MTIARVTEVSEELAGQLGELLPQLGSTALLTRDHLEEVVQSPSTELYVATDPREEGQIAGMLTLACYPIPSGTRFWIEDVVVDDAARGKGIGEALVRRALDRARELGAAYVDLTSAPRREAANRLYRRIGFQQRVTNAYRYSFTENERTDGI